VEDSTREVVKAIGPAPSLTAVAAATPALHAQVIAALNG